MVADYHLLFLRLKANFGDFKNCYDVLQQQSIVEQLNDPRWPVVDQGKNQQPANCLYGSVTVIAHSCFGWKRTRLHPKL